PCPPAPPPPPPPPGTPRHSRGVNKSTGPDGSLESRTATRSPPWATSTQPLVPLWLLLCQFPVAGSAFIALPRLGPASGPTGGRPGRRPARIRTSRIARTTITDAAESLKASDQR